MRTREATLFGEYAMPTDVSLVWLRIRHARTPVPPRDPTTPIRQNALRNATTPPTHTHKTESGKNWIGHQCHVYQLAAELYAECRSSQQCRVSRRPSESATY